MSNVIQAKKVFYTLCNALDRRGWNYKAEEDNLLVFFGVNGDDIPIQIIIVIDVERQLVRLLSPLSFEADENVRVELAIACCAASYRMANGSFDFDLASGNISFRMATAFENSVIGEELFDYMIDCSCSTVDRYNDKIKALCNGEITIEEFLDEEQQ